MQRGSGGDQFAAVLADLAMAEARALGEAVRRAIEDLDQPLKATVTIRIVGWLPGSEPIDEALRTADTALYRGKTAGGNRVHVFNRDEEPDTPPWPRSER